MGTQNCWIVWLLGIMAISVATCSMIDPDAEDYGNELKSIIVDIKPGTYIEYDEDGTWKCPETFQLTFDLESKPFSIHLVRAPGTRSTNLPIYVSEGKHVRLQERKVPKPYCTYQDIHTNSAFTVTLDDSTYILDGTFRKKGNLFGMHPKTFHGVRSKRSTDNSQEHSLFFLSQDDGFLEKKKDQQKRLKRTSKTRYEVEVLAFIDYSVYERFENSNSWDASTEEKLAYHFSHILNEVSLLYAGIDDQDYEISVQLAGLVAAKTPLGSPWTDQYSTESEINLLLKHFKTYMNEVLPGITELPSYDHAMLFTQKRLYNSWEFWYRKTEPIGEAYIGGVCTEKRMSVVENLHMFKTIWTAAHELGHNLGAHHDGLHNDCHKEKMFVMTPIIKARTTVNYRNIYQFSSCSKRSMKANLANISESDPCLFNTTAWDNTVIKTQLETPPGQIYSLDEQCQAAYRDTRSYFCGTQSNAVEICRKLVCWNPKKEECVKFIDVPANKGTTCGYKKWCIRGECVYNRDAPPANDNCIFGDSKRTYRGQTCHELTVGYLDNCSHDTIRKLCCASCHVGEPAGLSTHNRHNNVTDDRKPLIPGTERENATTGNITETCGDDPYALIEGVKCEEAIKKSPFLCYNSTYRGLCCASCAVVYQPNEVGCEYGDAYSGCKEDTSMIKCSLYKEKCCKSCKPYKEAIEVIFGNNKPYAKLDAPTPGNSRRFDPRAAGILTTIGIILVLLLIRLFCFQKSKSDFKRTESTYKLVADV